MSNTINWFRESRVDRKGMTCQRLYDLLMKDKEQEYYQGKLTPEEEAEMIAFLDQYTDKKYDTTPAGAQA